MEIHKHCMYFSDEFVSINKLNILGYSNKYKYINWLEKAGYVTLRKKKHVEVSLTDISIEIVKHLEKIQKIENEK